MRGRTAPLHRRPGVPGFAALVVASAVAMAIVTPVDYAWTAWLEAHPWQGFTDWMRRTLFEGDLPGGPDASAVLALLVVWAYARSYRQAARAWLVRWRPALGYLLTVALVAGVGLVRSLKWAVGRVRPWDVIGSPHRPYTEWYEFGDHFIAEGAYNGSFPSGHAAAVFMFMALAYVLLFDPALPRRWRVAGLLVALFALGAAAAMNVANAMAGSHWLSDGVFSVFACWLLVHAFYFWVLRVPEQRRHFLAHGRHALLPRWWEARLCGYGAMVLLGLVLAVLGVRALWEGSPELALLLPAGAVLAVAFAPRMAAVYNAFRRQYASADAR